MKWRCREVMHDGDGPVSDKIHVLDFAFGGPTGHDEAAESFVSDLVAQEQRTTGDGCDVFDRASYVVEIQQDQPTLGPWHRFRVSVHVKLDFHAEEESPRPPAPTSESQLRESIAT